MPKKIVDRRNKAANFYKDAYVKYIKSQINCINLGRVSKYNKAEHTCEIQLLPLQSDGEKRAMLVEVIVPASIWQTDKAMAKIKEKTPIEYEPLKVNSVVTVGFFDREIDNFKGKSNYKIESDRMHSLNDAVVLGVIKP